MDPQHLIAAYQPLPFPLPVWLMQILLVAGMYLHVLPMNVAFGGGFICAALFIKSGGDRNAPSWRAAKALAVSLPLFISFAITQGIVPLLFVQLLYGPAFYTSSVLMAVPWFGLIGILLVSYYLSYLTVYKVLEGPQGAAQATKAAITLLTMSVGFALIGFIFTNNMTLMLTPEKWFGMYQFSPHGLNMNVSEPQIVPRYLHFTVASLAVAGMTLGCFGLYMLRREEEFGRWLVKTGSRIFLGFTLVQIPVGLWFLKSLPQNYMSMFLGGDTVTTATFAAAMVLMVLAIIGTAIASSSGGKAPFLLGLVSNALLILTMIVNRHQLRLAYLNPHLTPENVPIQPQWDLLAIFLVSTVALIFFLIWLSRLMWAAFHPQKKSEELQTTMARL